MRLGVILNAVWRVILALRLAGCGDEFLQCLIPLARFEAVECRQVSGKPCDLLPAALAEPALTCPFLFTAELDRPAKESSRRTLSLSSLLEAGNSPLPNSPSSGYILVRKH